MRKTSAAFHIGKVMNGGAFGKEIEQVLQEDKADNGFYHKSRTQAHLGCFCLGNWLRATWGVTHASQMGTIARW